MYRYSARLSWSFSPNALSSLILKKRSAGCALLDLTETNPSLALRDYPHQAIAAALAEVTALEYHPEPLGALIARQAIAEAYASRGIAITADRIALTTSTSEAYSILFKLLCDPGHEILVPVPSYPLFEYLAGLDSVRVVPYPLVYDGCWSIEFSHLTSRITEATRAIVVVNPNNPTGSFLKSWEAAKLLQLSEQRELPIISDEVFSDYTHGAEPNRCATLIHEDSPLVFSLNGLSKMAGMPQLKLGWIVVSGAESNCRDVCRRLELILDTYLSVATPVQLALRSLLRVGDQIRTKMLETVRNNLITLQRALKQSPAHVLHSEGGWSAIVRLPNTRSEQDWITSLLEERDTIVQPGYFFDMPSEPYGIVSLITAPDVFAQGIERLRIHAG